MHYDNRHSMLVAWAKVALPLSALALLSVLFLFSGKADPEMAQLYAKVDVAELAREQRMTAPEYSGMTEDGAALTVTAAAARPDTAGSGASAVDLKAKLETPGGFTADLAAKAGRIDPGSGAIVLSDQVTVQTSSGYRLATTKLEVATDRTALTAPEPVRAEGPFGTITADQMRLGTSETGAQDLVFNGHVRLLYQPQE